jgi:hypothetical protein
MTKTKAKKEQATVTLSDQYIRLGRAEAATAVHASYLAIVSYCCYYLNVVFKKGVVAERRGKNVVVWFTDDLVDSIVTGLLESYISKEGVFDEVACEFIRSIVAAVFQTIVDKGGCITYSSAQPNDSYGNVYVFDAAICRALYENDNSVDSFTEVVRNTITSLVKSESK